MVRRLGVLLFLFASGGVQALDNGLARKPPLAWSSWLGLGDRDSCNETTVKQAADAMVSSGMLAHGYDTLVISDCWASKHRSNVEGPHGEPAQFLPPIAAEFPNGMKPVVDYIHARGLKAGLSTNRGGRPDGTFDATCDAVDAATFAVWGVDWLKLDNCGDREPVTESYPHFAQAQNKTGRPTVINLRESGNDKPWLGWGATAGNSYRVTGDHCDAWAPKNEFAAVANETALTLHQCDMADARMLYTIDQASGEVSNQYDRKALSLNGCSAADKDVVLFPWSPGACHAAQNQRWELVVLMGGAHQFKNRLSGGCLRADRAAVEAVPCDEHDAWQRWVMTDTGAGIQIQLQPHEKATGCLRAGGTSPPTPPASALKSCKGALPTDHIIQSQRGMSKFSGRAGAWNDLDMVFTGLAQQAQAAGHYFAGQSEAEYVSEFSLFALLQSPLVWTGDVRNMTAFQKHVLFNDAVLQVNQDVCEGSVQGDLLAEENGGEAQTWGRRMCNGSFAVVLYNRGEVPATLSASFAVFNATGWDATTSASVADLWSGEAASALGKVSAKVEPHGVFFGLVTRR